MGKRCSTVKKAATLGIGIPGPGLAASLSIQLPVNVLGKASEDASSI